MINSIAFKLSGVALLFSATIADAQMWVDGNGVAVDDSGLALKDRSGVCLQDLRQFEA